MARKFTSFKDWTKDRKPIDEAAGAAQAKLDARSKINEIRAKIKAAQEAEDDMGVQILEIDLKMAQLDLQKTDLQAQKEHLSQTKKIADANKQAADKGNE